MKFKKILKRKVYPTWTNTQRIKGYKVYVFYMPDIGCYHFQIDYDSNIIYISLNDNIKFNSFEDCCLAAEQWIKKSILL